MVGLSMDAQVDGIPTLDDSDLKHRLPPIIGLLYARANDDVPTPITIIRLSYIAPLLLTPIKTEAMQNEYLRC